MARRDIAKRLAQARVSGDDRRIGVVERECRRADITRMFAAQVLTREKTSDDVGYRTPARSGLVLTVVAQASLRGILSPARLQLASLQTMEADWRALLMMLPDWLTLGMALIGLLPAAAVALHAGLRPFTSSCALTVGLYDQ